MKRKIVHIDEDKCVGCGACADACHEGAIIMVDGKAKLMRDDYCDGFGDCLPACPAGAISFEEREADAYDAEAVKIHKANKATKETKETGENREMGKGPQILMHQGPGGCPGSQIRQMNHQHGDRNQTGVVRTDTLFSGAGDAGPEISQLQNWPVQIKLAPAHAPYFDGAKLLIAADCTAYAYASFHKDFMKGKTALIGCPKLDGVDYAVKLTEIIKQNDIRSVTIVRMEVPCCGGLEMAAKRALQDSGKFIPWQVITISIDGKILD